MAWSQPPRARAPAAARRCRAAPLLLSQRAEVVLDQVAQAERDARRVVALGRLALELWVHRLIAGPRRAVTRVTEVGIVAAVVRSRVAVGVLLGSSGGVDLAGWPGAVLGCAARGVAAALAVVTALRGVAAL